MRLFHHVHLITEVNVVRQVQQSLLEAHGLEASGAKQQLDVIAQLLRGAIADEWLDLSLLNFDRPVVYVLDALIVTHVFL